ncbi:hypothetical protein G6Z34_13845 [Clostridium perfringens]|uniref:Uncharacterized protein n=1 Tax=Clostridium perfringens TaxID=1502 RepID=A0AAP6WNN6_CLOPF|nr:hypothetical protein [Clostridium perfringens]NGU31168.1 hypothetical protein [Clostridium perfringens]
MKNNKIKKVIISTIVSTTILCITQIPTVKTQAKPILNNDTVSISVVTPRINPIIHTPTPPPPIHINRDEDENKNDNQQIESDSTGWHDSALASLIVLLFLILIIVVCSLI